LQVTLRTKSVIDGDLTIREFVNDARSKYNVQLDSMNANGTWTCAAWKVDPAAFDRKIASVLVSEFKQQLLARGQFFIAVNIRCVDEFDGEIELIPPVLLKVRERERIPFDGHIVSATTRSVSLPQFLSSAIKFHPATESQALGQPRKSRLHSKSRSSLLTPNSVRLHV
jgi:predicted RNA-binding Zn ribbon-like protein